MCTYCLCVQQGQGQVWGGQSQLVSAEAVRRGRMIRGKMRLLSVLKGPVAVLSVALCELWLRSDVSAACKRSTCWCDAVGADSVTGAWSCELSKDSKHNRTSKQVQHPQEFLFRLPITLSLRYRRLLISWLSQTFDRTCGNLWLYIKLLYCTVSMNQQEWAAMWAQILSDDTLLDLIRFESDMFLMKSVVFIKAALDEVKLSAVC